MGSRWCNVGNGMSKFFGGVGLQELLWARLAWRGSGQRMDTGMQAFANTVSSCILRISRTGILLVSK
jgi:hypothetical protein